MSTSGLTYYQPTAVFCLAQHLETKRSNIKIGMSSIHRKLTKFDISGIGVPELRASHPSGMSMACLSSSPVTGSLAPGSTPTLLMSCLTLLAFEFVTSGLHSFSSFPWKDLKCFGFFTFWSVSLRVCKNPILTKRKKNDWAWTRNQINGRIFPPIFH